MCVALVHEHDEPSAMAISRRVCVGWTRLSDGDCMDAQMSVQRNPMHRQCEIMFLFLHNWVMFGVGTVWGGNDARRVLGFGLNATGLESATSVDEVQMVVRVNFERLGRPQQFDLVTANCILSVCSTRHFSEL
jgi:hypothetical protein